MAWDMRAEHWILARFKAVGGATMMIRAGAGIALESLAKFPENIRKLSVNPNASIILRCASDGRRVLRSIDAHVLPCYPKSSREEGYRGPFQAVPGRYSGIGVAGQCVA
jgi:hypothetical protein